MSKSPPQHGVAILYAIAIAAIALDALTFFVTFPVGAALRVVVHSLVALLRHVALPLAVVGSAAWRFRDPILARGVAWLEANKGVRVAAPTCSTRRLGQPGASPAYVVPCALGTVDQPLAPPKPLSCSKTVHVNAIAHW